MAICESSFAIHWFRRDLRLSENSALLYALDKYQGRVLGFFSFDSKFLSRPDFSAVRFAFFLSTLEDLREQLRKAGGDLLVLDQRPQEAFRVLLDKCQVKPSEVVWNRDYEPFARERDAAVEKLLQKEFGIATHHERDHLLIEPEEILEGLDRGPYQVFTPFQKRWMELFRSEAVQERLKKGVVNPTFSIEWKSVLKHPSEVLSQDALDIFRKENQKYVNIPIPKAGREAVLAKVKEFSKHIENYATNRDIPSVAGTSQLSIFFKNGSVTNAQVIRALGLRPFRPKAPSPKGQSSADKFLSELVWREFYYHILYWYPHVEHESFRPEYKVLPWKNNEKWFAAWKEGRTGYPIVDAGMRQLNQTGWMHNRVRMIVASFLTKDLLIDWRWGERYFMEKLLDGDLAPNNGGWQWASSTGCDPQPYFRIFNPALQSEKFDSSGTYIRRFVSELQSVETKQIHRMPGASGYPKPIVDHALQRDLALAMYSKAKEK